MAYRNIKPNTKAQAVLDLIKGENISVVARKYKVSRSSLYAWLDIARTVLKEYFSHKFSQDREKNDRLERELADRNARIKNLEKTIRDQKATLTRLRDRLKVLKDIARPIKCEDCGCEKIYKNGFYEMTTEYLCKHLTDGDHKVKVQHFICAACQKSYCAVDPFSNIFILSPDRDEGTNGGWLLDKCNVQPASPD